MVDVMRRIVRFGNGKYTMLGTRKPVYPGLNSNLTNRKISFWFVLDAVLWILFRCDTAKSKRIPGSGVCTPRERMIDSKWLAGNAQLTAQDFTEMHGKVSAEVC